jgi:hypothetical protein
MSSTTPNSISPRVSGDYLAVYGTINLSQSVASLLIVARQSEVATIPPRVPGSFHIRLYDANNNQLADYPFTPQIDTEDSSKATIRQIVPFVPGTRRIAIYSDSVGRQIGGALVSANPPTVNITGRTGGPSGPLTLTWTGTDPDGDALEYTLLYSADNRATWRPLATAITTNSFTIDASQLEGTSSGYFRVVASDGVLTGYAESGPFSVADKAPAARINSPAPNQNYIFGQLVTLEGSGQDFEDGTLNDAQLSWSSDRDGALGNGPLIHTASLSVGTHVITLRATDSHGQTTTTTRTIVIGATLSQPGPTLSVSPNSTVFLSPFGQSTTATQTVSIRNTGSGSLTWSATSDAAWLTLSATSGSAPADLTLTANLPASPVPPAHVTITAEGVANSPQVITITAQKIGRQQSIFVPLVLRSAGNGW